MAHVWRSVLTVAHVRRSVLTVAHVWRSVLTVAHVQRSVLTVAHCGTRVEVSSLLLPFAWVLVMASSLGARVLLHTEPRHWLLELIFSGMRGRHLFHSVCRYTISPEPFLETVKIRRLFPRGGFVYLFFFFFRLLYSVH